MEVGRRFADRYLSGNLAETAFVYYGAAMEEAW